MEKYFGGPAECIFRTEDSFKSLVHIYQTTRRLSRKTNLDTPHHENRKPHKTALLVERLNEYGMKRGEREDARTSREGVCTGKYRIAQRAIPCRKTITTHNLGFWFL